MTITTSYSKESVEEMCDINDSVYPFDINKELRYIIPTCDVWRAVEDGKLLGYMMVKDMGNPHIWSIAVHPDYQGRGIGGNLIHAAIGHYYKLTPRPQKFTLHVHVDNPAQALYYNYGFRVTEVLDEYYPNGNGLTMERPF